MALNFRRYYTITADNAHITFKNVPKLRNLIKRCFAKKLARFRSVSYEFFSKGIDE